MGGGGALTASIREQITASVFSLLQNTTGVGGRVYRSRVEAFSRGSAPALVVESVANTPTKSGSSSSRVGSGQAFGVVQLLELRMLLLIDHPIPDLAADPIIVDIHDRITDDLTLGGLAMDVTPGETRWDQEVNGVAVVSHSYTVSYRTLIKDLTSA